MRRGFAMVRDAVKQCPLPLLSISDKKLLDIAEGMMPYSIGIEFEANVKSEFIKDLNPDWRWKEADRKIKTLFPDLLDVNFDGSEQRIRIPSGIKGMVVLYQFCDWMKENMELNEASGLHYHIDFTDVPYMWEGGRNLSKVISNNEKWIMATLKTWNYKGTYNSWEFTDRKTAVKAHETYKTVEVRIGEMTFDYDLIMKRILHLQNIAKKLKTNILQQQKKEEKQKRSLKSPNKRTRTKVKEISLSRIRFLASMAGEDFITLAYKFVQEGYNLTS